MKSPSNRPEDANRTLSTMTVFRAHIPDMCAWLQTQVLLESHVPQKSFVIIMPSYLHQILHQDTHVTLTHTFHKNFLLNTPFASNRSSTKLLTHPSKPQEKFGAFPEQAPSTPSGGPRNHVGWHEHARQEVLRGHQMAVLCSRELFY